MTEENALLVRDDDSVVTVPAIPSRASEYARASRSKGTWSRYQTVIRLFTAWCEIRGYVAAPASVATVVEYLSHLADEGRAVATINLHAAAIVSAHKVGGHPISRVEAGGRNIPSISDTLKGIRREKGRPQRQATALDPATIIDMVGRIDQKRPADVRDRALLGLGFAGALRRSEIVGLDWQQQGSGLGYVTLREGADEGLVITLLRSKANQEGKPEELICRACDMKATFPAVKAWIALAGIKPGKSLFRPIDQHGNVSPNRLHPSAISMIIRRRLCRVFRKAGMTREEAKEKAEAYSGHSLRAGYATTAARKGLPEWKIRNRTRHKTAALVARYVRAAEEWTDDSSSLKDVGF